MTSPVFSVLMGSALCSSALLASPIEIGAPIPKVSCSNQDGETVALDKLSENEWVLVYFYPKAGTPGCTKQACSLRDAYTQLTDAGVKVIGVSADSPAGQKRFAEKHQLPFILLADKDLQVIKAFGVPRIKMIGGLAKRQAYLFKNGKLVWRDLKASTTEQAADILAQIRH